MSWPSTGRSSIQPSGPAEASERSPEAGTGAERIHRTPCIRPLEGRFRDTIGRDTCQRSNPDRGCEETSI